MTGGWSVVYPHRRTPWAALAADGVTAARFHPESGRVEGADPTADPGLPGLPTALTMGRLVSYRPGRRAVVASQDGNCYFKVVRPDKVAALAGRHAAMAELAASAGLVAPEVLWLDDEMGLLATASLPGVTLHSSLWTVSPGEMAELGRALARLALQRAPEVLRASGDDAGWWLATVTHWDPDAGTAMIARIERLLDLPLPAGGGAPSHGDLHDKNVIVGARSFGLIDLDGAGLGAQHTDLVCLIAHIELRAIQAEAPEAMRDRLSSSLVSGFGEVLAGDRLGSFVARELARLACVYRFRRAGRSITEQIVARAEALAEGAA